MAGLRVAVATIGRHHSFDLARELQDAGCLAAIYTGFPRWSVRDAGVAPARIRSFPWIQTPKVALQRWRMMPPALERAMAWHALEYLDRHIARSLVPCDVFTALSGTGLGAGAVAKAQGAAYVCDRGSAHIQWQDRTLREEFAMLDLPFAGVDPRMIDKETREYALADALTVPSSFARETFIELGVAADKIHRISYGVDLAKFHRRAPRDDGFRVLFVGVLSAAKGLQYLLQGFAGAALANAKLVLVGPAAAETGTLLARFPVNRVERTGVLSQDAVAEQMSRASVLVLPSLHEGLALVMAQALACGLPVIASRNTGAEDLFADGAEGFIVDVREPEAIAERLTRLAGDRALLDAMSEAAVRRVRGLGGWAAYGRESVALFRTLAGAIPPR